MDLVLHKKLLTLQAENAFLREELQKLQEISDEKKKAYILAASTGKGAKSKRTNVRDLAADDQTEAGITSTTKDKRTHFEKLKRREAGIERAVRLLGKDKQK